VERHPPAQAGSSKFVITRNEFMPLHARNRRMTLRLSALQNAGALPPHRARQFEKVFASFFKKKRFLVSLRRDSSLNLIR
jgi:hypothetical protein